MEGTVENPAGSNSGGFERQRHHRIGRNWFWVSKQINSFVPVLTLHIFLEKLAPLLYLSYKHFSKIPSDSTHSS